MLPDVAAQATIALRRADDVLVLLGREQGWLGQSIYQQALGGGLAGAPPPVDLAAEKAAGDLVRGLIRSGAVSAVHDCSDGGLLVAIAEMALAGGLGVRLEPAPAGLPEHAGWFGEDQGRYVLSVAPEQLAALQADSRALGLPLRMLGVVAGDALVRPGEPPLPLVRLQAAHEAWLPRYMG